MSNVPDDWDGYYTNCSLCGCQYHMSEGGCGCTEDLRCSCGKGDWEVSYGALHCSACGSGPFEANTIRREKTRVARKVYLVGTDCEIRPGDIYREIVTRGHFSGGKWGPWETQRARVEKGPAWVGVAAYGDI